MTVARKTYNVRLDRGGNIVAGKDHTAASGAGQDDVPVHNMWGSLSGIPNPVSEGNRVWVWGGALSEVEACPLPLGGRGVGVRAGSRVQYTWRPRTWIWLPMFLA